MLRSALIEETAALIANGPKTGSIPYENLFDQHVEKDYVQEPGSTYSVDIDYEVTVDGETQRVETRYEAMELVNDHEAERDFNRANQDDAKTEAFDQYLESLYDELVTRRTVDDDGGGYSLVPQTELEVELGDESHRVQTRDEALELIKEYYNEHGLPASGGS